MSLFTAQLRASRHVTCLHLPQRRLLEKEDYYALVLERQAGTLLWHPSEDSGAGPHVLVICPVCDSWGTTTEVGRLDESIIYWR